MASTGRGVRSILLGDDPTSLVLDLRTRFPGADCGAGDRAFEPTLGAVIGLLDNPRIGLDLPLDVRGTAFQLRVWEALRAIPSGRTASYTEVARAIDRPESVRAVAQACGANPLAVAVPCHRVVRSDGGLAGYRWGIARKAELLRRERADHAGA